MKKIVFVFSMLISFLSVGQEYKKDLSGIKTVKIYANTSFEVEANSNNELTIKTNEKISENRKKKNLEKRKGLKAVYTNGIDNTNDLGFSIEKESSTLIIKDLKAFFNRSKVKVTLPKNVNLIVKCRNIGDLSIKGFEGEIEAKTNTGNIKLIDITGPLTVNSSTGHIKVVFSKVNQKSPISIRVASGEIDVTIPANTKADLDINARGTLYTNLDIKQEKKEGLSYSGGGSRIKQKLNNGGVKIKLSTSIGDIYLRKK